MAIPYTVYNRADFILKHYDGIVKALSVSMKVSSFLKQFNGNIRAEIARKLEEGERRLHYVGYQPRIDMAADHEIPHGGSKVIRASQSSAFTCHKTSQNEFIGFKHRTNCMNCGAPLRGGICEYCGTEYLDSNPPKSRAKLE